MKSHSHEIYMARCIELALHGAGSVAPNPMVGAVLVHGEGHIIGEGYHQQYGDAHAEVNCIASVASGNRSLISSSTLYVSLEPCAHHGKTPPCVDLIIKNRIPKVVVGCRDPFEAVNGKGIEKLITAGIDVQSGVLEAECKWLNRRFFTYHTLHRPYIILKWAQSADARIAGENGKRTAISNVYSNHIVHKWRSEEAAILVGRRTAETDDPVLNTRLWPGKNPIRIVTDSNLKLSDQHHLFDGSVQTIVFNSSRQEQIDNLFYHIIDPKNDRIGQMIKAIYDFKILSLLVEGGAEILQSFIDACMWDEVRTIENHDMIIGEGIAAPHLNKANKFSSLQYSSDHISFYQPR